MSYIYIIGTFPSTQQVDWLQGIKLRRILIWTVVGCQQKPAHRVTGSVRWSTYCLKISKIAKDILSKEVYIRSWMLADRVKD
jgi:hypothetical protein